MKRYVCPLILTGFLLFASIPRSEAEVMLQFFNNTWQEIIEKMPEIAETGYTSLWLPPPQKASGDLSVGYDLWDPFDLGGNPQRTGGRTRYGTEEELLRLIETAHRFGIRVYFDNIMNHRAFNIPGYNEDTPIDLYPGMLPEDFHLRVTEEGFYRPWGNTVNWGSTWEVQNRYLSGLIDIAQEASGGGWNVNFGPNEGDTHPGISFVRHPNNPEFYDYHPTEGLVGFGSPLITTNVIAENPGFYTEDVGGYLMRSIRWLVDYTKLDGLRLDAVKHVPGYFFGRQYGTEEEKNTSTDGYIGQAQLQFNRTRGFSEEDLRASMWDVELPRVSLMVFGEHMGEPPPYSDYWDAGMRLLDARTHSTLNSLSWLSEGEFSNLEHSEYVPGFQMGKNLGVYYAKSHDDDVAFNEHLQYAINLTRAGLPNIYTDGNRQAPTLGQSGGAFPRHANTRPFGQFGDTRIPNLVHIHNSFARGWQIPRWSDGQVIAYERRDKRENWEMTDTDGTVMFFMMTRDWESGHHRDIPTTFPDGAILWQYGHGGGQFYHQVQDGTISVTVPPAGYFIFSWRSPEESDLWKWGGGKPIEIYSNGEPADTISYVRRDGPDGDSQFNPYGLPNRGYPEGVEPEPFTYLYTIPRVTSPTNLSFFAHVDGSADNVLMKLNGGIPLNDQTHHGGDPRDNPPGWNTTDVFLGYEQADFHSRIWPEKFGSVDAARNKIGSAGAEAYQFTVGSAGFTLWESEAENDWDSTYGPVFVYHNPEADTDDDRPQMTPAPENAAGQEIHFEVKTGHAGDTDRVFLYYTTDGTWPEGAGGMGIGSTKAVELFWRTNVTENGGGGNGGGNGGGPLEDNSGNYPGGWTHGSNGGNGFGAWAFDHHSGSGWAGSAIWNPVDAGITGLGTEAFGLGANPEGSGANAEVSRNFSSALSVGSVFSFDLGLNWDSDVEGSNRGFILLAGATELININMANSAMITINGDTLFGEYGTQTMTLNFEYVASGSIRVWGTGRDGLETYDETLSVPAGAPSGFKFYFNATHNQDERQMYFDNLSITPPEEPSGMDIGPLGGEVNDWWAFGEIPAQPADTMIRYKVSSFRQQGTRGEGDWDVPFPNSWHDIGRKKSMMGTWKIENFNPSTVVYHPHNDYGVVTTGLVEGINFIAVRAFLERPGKASIYNTFYQPFYYDAEPPTGEVVFPQENDTVFDNRYGVVVRTDPTVRRVWYNIVDSDPTNDDGATGARHGNGTNALGQTAWVEAQRVNPSIQIDSEYPLEWRFNYVNIPDSGTATIRVKLAEYSSSTNPLVSDEEGRFTTLERTINTQGPAYRMNVAWPQNDGDVVSEGYVMKVSLSRALWTSEPDVVNRTLITINGVPQDRDLYQPIWYGEGDHELGYPLPDLFNGDPNYEHEILVTHTNAAGSGITLTAARRVRVTEGAGIPPVLIIDPPEFNLDGARYQIVLPDSTNAPPGSRRHNVSVQTWDTAETVWISFTNSVGYVTPIPAATNTLSGTVSVTSNSTMVAGSGTEFDVEVSAGSVLEIGAHRMVVGSIQSSNQLTLTRSWPGATASGLTAKRITGNPTPVGNSLFWQFLWTNLQAGTYTLVAHGDFGEEGIRTNERTTQVILRQMVEEDGSGDSDNDGIPDDDEVNRVQLPGTNPETWSNGDVHIWMISGRTDPLRPITDGGGLPDGLQLGLSAPIDPAATDTLADTNGDGWPNFIADRDPPIFNTTDNWEHPQYNFHASRTDQIGGSMTDPNRLDTDGDGLPDHLEDLNRNGRVDVGLVSPAGVVTNILRSWFEDRNMHLPMVRNTSRVDRDALPPNARFLETDPNNSDTIGDGMSDGAADVNANGRVDMLLLHQNGSTEPFDISDTNNWKYLLGMDDASRAALAAAGEPNIISRAINYDALFEDFGRPRRVNGDWDPDTTNVWPRILFLELDPLVRDTNEDGLRDGWKARYGLDPWDDGWYNLRTGEMNTSNTQQGADGDLTGDGITNAQHQSAGTDPRVDVNIPVPPGSITIGPGPQIGELNGVPIYEEFMDWTWDDLRALDYYEGDGPNSEQGDVYRGWDGYDTSRDMVAFYTRDGGASGEGGDDRFYFRVDFYDLQPHAEDEHLDIYVVIDTGNPEDGERVLPDEVDTLTDMRWQLVVAVYNWAHGRVYVDMDSENNTSTFGDDLFTFGGVVVREDYYLGAYYNSELDAVEFAIDRQALLDVGYIGDPDVLNYQVFTTKPGTQNSPPGPGDIGGRSDIRDSILNDYIAEDDHWAQDGLRGTGSVLREWIRGDARPNRAKFAKIVHGNQAIQPGSVIQDLINNDAGAGYYRVLDVHELFGMPLNLHVTPTLASALQWASVDPAAGKAYRDGPALNARIADLAAEGQVALMASTFSDHMMPYFTPEFIADNVALATEFLEEIYGVTITSNSVFWTPERLLDADVFNKIAQLGFRATVLDQMEHLFQWYGRQAALGTRGYQINRIDGVDTFAINNGANNFRFANHHNGLNMPLRRLFNRQARGNWDQVVILMSNWEDFTSKNLADAYDRNILWMANRPWIHGVTLESILREEVDLDGDGEGNAWYVHERSSPGADKLSHNYLNYMTRLDYDNWYLGSGLEEGLYDKVFDGRPGVPLPDEYGMLYTAGIVKDAWDAVRNVTHNDASRLARGVMHASVFQTAFHSGEVGNMAKYSNGTYIWPDEADKDLAGFAAIAQAQTRKAAIYDRIDQWLAMADTLSTAQTSQEDVDLDGENEYLLYNRHVFAVFERLGGRMIAAWVRDPDTGAAYQTIGNLVSWAGSESEFEGEFNMDGEGNIGAYRTSALKDWWAATPEQSYVNDLYSFSPAAGGWEIQSSDEQITKTVTLGDDDAWFTVNYVVDPSIGTLYVRHGLSPDLYGLLLHGQQYLSAEQHDGGVLTLSHLHPERTVSAMVAYSNGFNAVFNDEAVDGTEIDTRRMRNQAQTHQVELSGSGTFSFAIGFEAAEDGEQYNDGVPYSWLIANEYDPETVNVNTTMASNQVNTLKQAFIANLDPRDPASFFEMTKPERRPNSIVIRFATRPEREYIVWYNDNGLITPTWLQGPTDRIQGTGDVEEWEDVGPPDTDPHPMEVDNRFYKIEVVLPE